MLTRFILAGVASAALALFGQTSPAQINPGTQIQGMTGTCTTIRISIISPTGTPGLLCLPAGSFNCTSASLCMFIPVAAVLPVFVDEEIPVGALNGTNATFTIANVPNPATSLQCFRNGLRVRLGGDYTFTGQTLTFLTAAVPQSGDTLDCSYRH